MRAQRRTALARGARLDVRVAAHALDRQRQLELLQPLGLRAAAHAAKRTLSAQTVAARCGRDRRRAGLPRARARTSAGSCSCSITHSRAHWSWNQVGPAATALSGSVCNARARGRSGRAGGRDEARGTPAQLRRAAAASERRAQRRSEAAHAIAAARLCSGAGGGGAQAATGGARSDTVIASMPAANGRGRQPRAWEEGRALGSAACDDRRRLHGRIWVALRTHLRRWCGAAAADAQCAGIGAPGAPRGATTRGR